MSNMFFSPIHNIEVYKDGSEVVQKHFREWRTAYRAEIDAETIEQLKAGQVIYLGADGGEVVVIVRLKTAADSLNSDDALYDDPHVNWDTSDISDQ